MLNKRKAFTLVEVIVALSMFAISILVLTQSFLNGLICKTQLAQENLHPLLYQIIRSELKNMQREQVVLDHTVFYPDNETKISWSGSVNFTGMWNLFKVDVLIKGEDEKITFWIHNPTWMTKQEKLEFLSRHQEDSDE